MNAWEVAHELDLRAAREHGTRAARDIATIDRAVAIAAQQGGPCLSRGELHRLSLLAIAEIKLAAHHARRAGVGL